MTLMHNDEMLAGCVPKEDGWTYIGQVTGDATTIALPNDAKELKILCKIPYTSFDIYVNTLLLAEEIDTTGRFFDFGGSTASARVYVTKTYLILNSSWAYNDSYNSTTVTSVWYR